MNTDPQLLDATRRIYMEVGSPWPPAERQNTKLWKTLEESGLTLAWCPEEFGGAGGSVADGLSVIGIFKMFVNFAVFLFFNFFCSEKTSI